MNALAERRCGHCSWIGPAAQFQRTQCNECRRAYQRARYTAMREAAGKTVTERPRVRSAARSGSVNAPPISRARILLLSERRSLRAGVGMVRCMLPRRPETYADAQRRDQPQCGGLVLHGRREEHCREVHGCEPTSEILKRGFSAYDEAAVWQGFASKEAGR